MNELYSFASPLRILSGDPANRTADGPRLAINQMPHHYSSTESFGLAITLCIDGCITIIYFFVDLVADAIGTPVINRGKRREAASISALYSD